MAKGKGKSVKTDAQKQEAFRGAAQKKVNSIARAFQALAKMATSGRYSHTPADWKAMSDYIEEQGKACEDAFAGKKTAGESFTF